LRNDESPRVDDDGALARLINVTKTGTENNAAPESAVSGELVVVHRRNGTLIKGLLEWEAVTNHVIPPSHLPEALHIRGEAAGESSTIQLSEAKAVFFVKHHEGALDHHEVKFFSNMAATDLWVRIRFADGEVLEGQTHNGTRLLLDPGIWLRPFDSTGNNTLVYVPKSSVVEFHVMGVAIHRAEKVGAAGAAS
jgi:hypothetical protein